MEILSGTVRQVLPTVRVACVHLYHVLPSSAQPGTLPLLMAH